MNQNLLKKLILIGVLLWGFANGVLHAATVGTATKIAVSFIPSAYPAGTPNCSATVTANCAQGYTETIAFPDGSKIVIPTCTATVTTNCIAATASSFTYVSPTALSYGAYTISIVANAFGSIPAGGTNPTPLTSTASIANTTYAFSLTVAPAPGGVTVQFQ